MKMKRLEVAFFMILFFVRPFFARQISFQIVQKDKSAKSVTEKSLSVEDELFNGFFNKGYIVTNSSAVVSDSDESDEELWNKGFGDAFDGFSDVFVQVKVYFSEPRIDQKGKTVKDINRVSYKVTDIHSGENIEESSINYEEKTEDLKKISSDLINKLYRVIKAKS